MSRERELIQEMKDSLAASDAASESLQNGAAAGTQASADAAQGLDVGVILDSLASVGGSMVGDPLFYLKAGAVLVLTVMIIMLAFELIAGS